VKKIELYHLEKLIETKYGVPVKEDQKELLKQVIKGRDKLRKKPDLKKTVENLHTYTPSKFISKKPLVYAEKNVFFGRKRVPQKIIHRGVVKKRILRIPEQKLPERFRNLKPIKAVGEVNLGKLIPLLNDKNVKLVEINREGENVFVSGSMGKKKTGVILNKQELDFIMDGFSNLSKIPLIEGINKIAYGSFVLKGIVSGGNKIGFGISKLQEKHSSGVRVGVGHIRRRVY
jgi:hypothetical protein